MSDLRVTAIAGIISAKPKEETQNSSKIETQWKQYIRILLDSGSDGDLMFHKKGTHKYFLYIMRHLLKSWQMSNGAFTTNGKGNIQVHFLEYSNSKVVTITPDIIHFEKGTQNKPAFDLILGTKNLNDIGIILDFKRQIITIDEVVLPMRSIKQLPNSKRRASKLNNVVASNVEPVSMHKATQLVVCILDGKYEKADLR